MKKLKFIELVMPNITELYLCLVITKENKSEC